jgi:hypothetical protein
VLSLQTKNKITMTNKQRAEDIYAMLAQGQLFEAFDKYYAENVSMEDVGENNLRTGKAACRVHEEHFMGAVESFSGMGVDAITASDDDSIIMIENWMEIKFKGAPAAIKMSQVAVQKWENGLIVNEKFYHK